MHACNLPETPGVGEWGGGALELQDLLLLPNFLCPFDLINSEAFPRH